MSQSNYLIFGNPNIFLQDLYDSRLKPDFCKAILEGIDEHGMYHSIHDAILQVRLQSDVAG